MTKLNEIKNEAEQILAPASPIHVAPEMPIPEVDDLSISAPSVAASKIPESPAASHILDCRIDIKEPSTRSSEENGIELQEFKLDRKSVDASEEKNDSKKNTGIERGNVAHVRSTKV